MKNWGFINNLFKVLPLNPLQYKGFLDFKASLFTPETCYLSTADKEMMGLVVSSVNNCAYCLTTHSDVLRGLSGDPAWVDTLTYNYRSAKLTPKQRALCDYAFFVTAYPRESGHRPGGEAEGGGLQRPRDPRSGLSRGRVLQLHQPLGQHHQAGAQPRPLQPQPLKRAKKAAASE